jgi:hypothetical protein
MRIVQFFYARLFWLVPIWYGFTMFLTRWRRWPAVRRYPNTRAISEAISWGDGWRPDPIKGLLDVAMDPRKFQARIDAGETRLGDCDDHALYWAVALLKSGLATRAWIGSAWYADTRGKHAKGHVVCIFEHRSRLYWVDYGNPAPVTNLWGWAYAVALARGKVLYAAGKVPVELRGKRQRPKFLIRRTTSRTV